MSISSSSKFFEDAVLTYDSCFKTTKTLLEYHSVNCIPNVYYRDNIVFTIL